MTDQNSQFFAILTAVGEAKQANAAALGTSWTFAQMGVGDGHSEDLPYLAGICKTRSELKKQLVAPTAERPQ